MNLHYISWYIHSKCTRENLEFNYISLVFPNSFRSFALAFTVSLSLCCWVWVARLVRLAIMHTAQPEGHTFIANSCWMRFVEGRLPKCNQLDSEFRCLFLTVCVCVCVRPFVLDYRYFFFYLRYVLCSWCIRTRLSVIYQTLLLLWYAAHNKRKRKKMKTNRKHRRYLLQITQSLKVARCWLLVPTWTQK